jgi:hypothetical protein
VSELREGDLIIPRVWYQKLVNQNGRSDWLTIAILGEVLDHTDINGNSIIFFVSFEEIIEYFCKLYGVSIVCSRRALKRLEKKGLIIIQDWGDDYRDDDLELNSWSIHIPQPVLDTIIGGGHESTT